MLAPAEAAKVMTAPETAALFASFAMTVTFALAEPSDGMLGTSVETVSDATVLLVVPLPLLEEPVKVLPPHAPSIKETAANAAT